MATKSRSVNQIDDGAWIARWGRFSVRLWKQEDVWRSTAWETIPRLGEDARIELEHGLDFPDALSAARWAADVLESHGAKAFVDGRRVDLEPFLVFEPAGVVESA